MSRVVVISGHPDLEQSYTNKLILNQLEQRLESVDIRRLDRLYPDYQIDVAAEQQALIDADLVVLQFPFYWYSVPALLKKWLDDVFSYNFAYGSKGDKLKDKALIISVTIGGPEESYTPEGYNHFRIEELLKPLEQTAYLAGMNYCTPVYSHRMVYIPGVYNSQDAVESRARDHAERLINAVMQQFHSPEKQIEAFVSRWFAAFDRLPEDASGFLAHLSRDVLMHMPEGEFKGHAGFRDWYQSVRLTFQPNCQHKLEQLAISPTAAGYQVDLRIRLIAETVADSDLKGESIDLLVNETWQLKFDAQGQIIIDRYQVTPVAHAS